MQDSELLQQLQSRLDGVRPRERVEFARRLAGLERRVRGGQPIDRGLAKLAPEIEAACERVAARRAALPVPEYPDELPVVARREDIARAIADNQVVIVCGDTGSGKTTQLPKICLELGRGVAGLIGHTQPRRIAARSVAARIAEELKTEVGRGVGFKVRFSDHVSPESYLKLMTDGILLAEMQQDRMLTQYDTLIIDEAHERSLNIDFLLGYLKRLLPQRPDLKLIITSATIDPERFSRHFGDAPILMVEGRTYPVEVRYRPLVTLEDDDEDRSQTDGIVEACAELAREGLGDVLVFLPGEREIREAAEALRKHHPPHTEILPLYARLSAAEQHRVFEGHAGRRIVLATNVAETSLTVPGIRYVVDTGTARISRYSWRAKLQRLPIEPISQASADQRKGRCGRVGPGVCIRLYSEEDFASRPAFTDPEIQRTNLAAVVLQMGALGLGEVADFPFIDPPDPRLIKDGYLLLEELHAVDAHNRLTDIGRRLARLPVDPRLGRMLLAAEREGALREALVIVSALAVQDPRERPADRQQAADEAHKRFHDERSDFLAYLKLWEHYHEQARHHSKSQLRKLCQREFLSWMRMREWRETWRQLHGQLAEMGFRENQQPAEYEAIHRSLLTGLLAHVGFKSEDERDKHAYLGARNRKFHIFPGSGLHKRGPKWLMAAEITETARTYARTVARIKPEWIEQLGAHLLKHHIFEPHWEQRPARVGAFDKLTLYGLVVQPRKRVDYARTHPAEARELFIRHALVYGEFRSRGGFLAHNRALIEEVEELEAKARRPDILVDEHVLFEFYDRLVPAHINNGKAFERWREQAERENAQLLYLTRDALMQHGAGEITADRFPDQFVAGPGLSLPLRYRLEPGGEDDGVTLTVPLAALRQVEVARCEWLVPGLLEEKLTALIRGLPKALRKNFVPAPDFARACAQALAFGEGEMFEALAHQLKRMTGVDVPADALDRDALPEHLRMRFEVIDSKGKLLAAGRDLSALADTLEGRVQQTFEALPTQSLERDDVAAWDFGDLPESVDIEQHGLALKGYPALVREGEKVALRVLDSAASAEHAHREGVLGLLHIVLRERVKYLHKRLPHAQTMCLHFAAVGRCEALKDDLIDAVLEDLFLAGPLPRSEAEFAARVEAGRSEIVTAATQLAERMNDALATFHRIRQSLKGNVPLSWIEAAADVNDQLTHLVYPGFVRATPAAYRQHLPRYLKAIERRLERLQQQPDKDRRLRVEIEPLWARCKQRWGDGRNVGEALRDYRWQIEELRVSLFAQELGTPRPVSVARLEKQWKEMGSV
ncbi:ATP-dependent RNA helicase HrpA [Acidihalobacter ferrooxydans]|uniref:RNA helicase n=1 Tax=Acidihalobacter ferrooxydans TaxID=1765967 RepID=A0A1P8UFX4_9GAMM|nr:ATP-dependent RNA helicase HrpA [Acidihalobacter ferrooxydans]APZ42753.1 ATP-dependent RNA helicase HrpA [Acidihalobacter ferrooxydans]